nr:hypothetical protein Iba_chr04aCG7850 [Ipomoea batatas]
MRFANSRFTQARYRSSRPLSGSFIIDYGSMKLCSYGLSRFSRESPYWRMDFTDYGRKDWGICAKVEWGSDQSSAVIIEVDFNGTSLVAGVHFSYERPAIPMFLSAENVGFTPRKKFCLVKAREIYADLCSNNEREYGSRTYGVNRECARVVLRPEAWKVPGLISHSEVERQECIALMVLEQALSKYPDHILRDKLETPIGLAAQILTDVEMYYVSNSWFAGAMSMVGGDWVYSGNGVRNSKFRRRVNSQRPFRYYTGSK